LQNKFKQTFNLTKRLFKFVKMSTAQKIDKQQHIMDVAEQLFANEGFEGTSIRDLCAAANVNIAMIQYYFGGKEQLFKTLVERKAIYLKKQLELIVENKSLSANLKMDAVIESYVNRFFAQRAFHNMITREMSIQQRSPMHEEMADIFLKNMQLVKKILDEGIKKNEFKKIDVAFTITTIIGTITITLLNPILAKKMLPAIDFGNYDNPRLQKRIINHLQTLMQHHLKK
jgi:TetR/AcrR family transcriptional regulator, fatty acid metabolism regulator protein